MPAKIAHDILKDLEKARELHDRAVSDYTRCQAFSRLMSDILARLEDNRCFDAADRVMSILLDCNPKTGSHCDKAALVGKAVSRLVERTGSCHH